MYDCKCVKCGRMFESPNKRAVSCKNHIRKPASGVMETVPYYSVCTRETRPTLQCTCTRCAGALFRRLFSA